MASIKKNTSNLIFSNCCVGLRIVALLFYVILTVSISSCDGITTDTPIGTPKAATLQPEPHRPEPQEPQIVVSFSGLNDDTLAKIFFRTLSGDEPLRGSHPGNGEMDVILPEKLGAKYIVAAEAEGYVSNPISYTIQISGTLVYMVEDNQIAPNEVLELEFQFEPIDTPVGDSE
jgi:hypothetical protein